MREVRACGEPSAGGGASLPPLWGLRSLPAGEDRGCCSAARECPAKSDRGSCPQSGRAAGHGEPPLPSVRPGATLRLQAGPRVWPGAGSRPPPPLHSRSSPHALLAAALVQVTASPSSLLPPCRSSPCGSTSALSSPQQQPRGLLALGSGTVPSAASVAPQQGRIRGHDCREAPVGLGRQLPLQKCLFPSPSPTPRPVQTSFLLELSWPYEGALQPLHAGNCPPTSRPSPLAGHSASRLPPSLVWVLHLHAGWLESAMRLGWGCCLSSTGTFQALQQPCTMSVLSGYLLNAQQSSLGAPCVLWHLPFSGRRISPCALALTSSGRHSQHTCGLARGPLCSDFTYYGLQTHGQLESM